MNKDQLFQTVRDMFPEAEICKDNDGQVVIYTNLTLDGDELSSMGDNGVVLEDITPLKLELITSRCVDECIRQQVGLKQVGQLIAAYDLALQYQYEIPSEAAIDLIAGIIEPRNAQGGNNMGYRKVPVTFANGGSAVSPQDISAVAKRFWEFAGFDIDVDHYVKSWLQIHPYIDGNGRTAFIMYNWLNKTLENPVPLPDFFRGDPII